MATTVSRRAVTRGGLAAAAATALGKRALAQQYPSQDVHFICAFPAGGGADLITRYMAEKMRPLMGRTIIVENKPGALGNIATEYIARSKPDGHTVLIQGASAVAAANAILRHPTVDVSKAIRLAGTINRQATMLSVHAAKPWKTLADLTAALKEKKDKATYGTSNPVGKVMSAIYRKTMGLELVEVLYKAAPDMVNDLVSGSLDFVTADSVFTVGQERAGVVRPLALSSGEPLKASAGVPTMTQCGVPMDLTSYFAAIVPAATPDPIVEQLGKWVAEVVGSEETRKFLGDTASDPWVTTPAEAQAYYLKDIENWKNYVKIANIEQQG